MRTTVWWDPGNPLGYSKTKKQGVSKLEEKNVCKPWGKEEIRLIVYWDFRPRERQNKDKLRDGKFMKTEHSIIVFCNI
jgi:hypothetical protein